MHITKRVVLPLLLAGSLLAQDNPKAPPKLKDSVALELRTLQFQISQTNIQILQIQAQQAQWQSQYVALFRTALKDSGLDEAKYDIDPNTLQVKEKPHAAQEGKK